MIGIAVCDIFSFFNLSSRLSNSFSYLQINFSNNLHPLDSFTNLHFEFPLEFLMEEPKNYPLWPEFLVTIFRYLEIYGPVINYNCEISTIIFNCFHFLVLFNKELRKNAVFILMMGISISDSLGFIELQYIFKDDKPRHKYNLDDSLLVKDEMFLCLEDKYWVFSITGIINWILVYATRPMAIWMALLMAVIRTLSILFPMSIRVQRLTKTRNVVVAMLLLCLFWILFYVWIFRSLRLVWLPNIADKIEECRNDSSSQNFQTHILTTERYYSIYGPEICPTYETELEPRDLYVKLIPVVIYPCITIPLIFELWRIRRKKKATQADKTTTLIFVMTISFILSEGSVGSVTSLYYIAMNTYYKESEPSKRQFFTFDCFRSINALSHFFVCYWMSSQYRTIANQFMYCGRNKAVAQVQSSRRKVLNA
ncbi:hypothetical protein CAEBREN_07591 [Caenorhabditis brenneri]|uniref:G-protein coupled receptors family 1 profile domain-containing protein n=1 Tax=Caenorhabditis brenneri TaxID=135651 RepID=G0NI95_CAEBE|nr:hypothetical protein CAEBREN_07591 [Caenorhabditis brenneri]